MKVRREILKARTIILLAGAMAIVAGSATGAAAKDQKGMKTQSDQGWYFHGGFDAGGRFYARRPGTGFGYNADGSFLLPTQTDSRAKFEEYGKVPPGVFLDWIHLDIGSNDGRYRINFWGDDVGYNAQSYSLDFSEAGKQYLNFSWDQTPHLWSYSAKSLFDGVGTTNLTVNTAAQDYLRTATDAQRYSYFNSHAAQIDELSVRRDKFSASYRFTPTPDWDFRVSYSHEHRDGTRPGTLNFATNNGSRPTDSLGIPIPVDDTTQIPKASGEYSGVGPFGRYSFKLGYAGSIYTDDLSLLTIQSPFGTVGGVNYGTLRLVMPPSNQAHAFTGSAAFEIPLFMSRFTTTNQFSRRTQNDAFLDTSNNGQTADPLPIPSLDGDVRTFLTNNVLTSTLTKNLHNKFRFRYYEHLNSAREDVTFTNQLYGDATLTDRGPTEYESFKKTNVDEDLTWMTPVKGLTVGAGYGFEQWHRDNRFTHITNENTGRMFTNWILNGWAQWRTSYAYSVRRYRGDYEIDSWQNERMFDLANRDQHKARTLLDITVGNGLTVTPNGGLRWDDYPGDAPNQLGISSDHSWNAGVDVGFVVSPTLRLMGGYNFEHNKIDMMAGVPNAAGSCNPASGIVPLSCIWSENLTQTYHTLIASADWKVIPDRLGLRLRYVASWEREAHNDFMPCSINGSRCNGAGYGLPYPDDTNLFQQFEATARYHFDKDAVRKMGWNGKVIAKLRYRWQRNSGAYWQSDALSPYSGTTISNADSATFLAYDNPNYTVQLIAASLTFKW